jgi:molecular chaperone IbpA
MATFDFTPLFHSSVGFDRVPKLLADAMEAMGHSNDNYPPYNIEKCGGDEYRIVMAVAGFGKDDLEIVVEPNQLTVRGNIKAQDGRTFLHRGIDSRAFERRFELADFVKVTNAVLGDGLLVIDLKREVPEELKPRKIEINAGKIIQIEPKKLEKSAA